MRYSVGKMHFSQRAVESAEEDQSPKRILLFSTLVSSDPRLGVRWIKKNIYDNYLLKSWQIFSNGALRQAFARGSFQIMSREKNPVTGIAKNLL
jgi:hypothetical protein